MDKERLAEIVHKVDALQMMFAARDHAALQVRAVRHGDFDKIAPGIFPEDWPRPVAANLIDNMARDFAAKLTPLPSFNCSGASSLSEQAKKFADKRSRIANNYVAHSNLAAQRANAADSFNTHGMVAYSVEPDFDAHLPRIRVEDSVYVYPVWDRNMRTVAAAKVFYQYADSIEADYPDIAKLRKGTPGAVVAGTKYKIVKWTDKDDVVVYLPDLGNYILDEYRNPIGRCLYVCVPRPNGEGNFGPDLRGQYDDLVWPQLARNEFQILALEAADKAVRAPIVVPPDVTDVPFGPDAVIQTNNPQGVVRLKVDVPPASFQAMEWLRQDMQLGGMTNEGRSGQTNASVITGAGMEALNNGFSTQLAQAQELMRFADKQVIELCFEIDEKVWPNLTKEIRGQENGVPFTVKYTPSKDIKGDHTVDVQYGFLSGMDPNRSLIFILQAFGAGLISGDYAMRNLPAAFNVTEEAKKIELEHVRKALLDSLAASAQALPAMIAQGADPSALVAAIAAVASGLKDGKAIEDIVTKVFAPPPAPPAAPGGEMAAGTPPPEGPPGSEQQQAGQGGPPAAGPPGAQPGAQPSGPPDLMTLISGMSGQNGGRPNMGANVRRTMPAVGA